MWQIVIVVLVIGAAVAWLGWQGYRFVRPTNTTGCAGGCCHGGAAPKPNGAAQGKSEAAGVVFFPADDLARRVKARRGR